MRIVTRWNSALNMLESLDDLKECAMNALKSIGKYDLLLDKEKCELVHDLVKFLKPFKELTELVSDSNNFLGVIPLVKIEIEEICLMKADDIDEIKYLK